MSSNDAKNSDSYRLHAFDSAGHKLQEQISEELSPKPDSKNREKKQAQQAELAGDSETVFATEFQAIQERRAANGLKPSLQTVAAAKPTIKHDLVGLALSGGGLRSASFCLGALQGLYQACGRTKGSVKSAQKNGSNASPAVSDLAFIDYLSTVSGGGYIGSSLSLGMTRSAGAFPFGDQRSAEGDTVAVRHLRDNSRYLLHGGIGGVLSFVLVYLRGLVTSLICVAPLCLLAAAILLMLFGNYELLGKPFSQIFPTAALYKSAYMPLSQGLAIIGLGLLAFYAIICSVAREVNISERRRNAKNIALFVGFFVVPVIVLEAHAALLRSYFVSIGKMEAPSASSGFLFFKLETLTTWLKYLVPGLFAAGIAILPFVQKIAEAAIAKGDGQQSALIKGIASRIALFIVAAIAPLILWVTTMAVVVFFIEQGSGSAARVPGWGFGAMLFVAAVALAATGLWLININANSLHQIYRDRMSRAFLASQVSLEVADHEQRKKEIDKDDAFLLSQISTRHTPYHILNTALNLPGSAWANQRGRNAEFFMCSPCFIGSSLTGYVRTADAEMNIAFPSTVSAPVAARFNLGTAMAVSGAAIAPNMGMGTIAPLSFTVALLNLRLGRWALNPRHLKRVAGANGIGERLDRFPDMRHFLREAFSKTGFGIGNNANGQGAAAAAASSGGDDAYVFLSDGGHIENLGVYELLRRRCRLVIAVDAEHDPKIACGSLAQLERLARIDFGIKLLFDTSPIIAANARANSAMADENKPPVPANERHGPHVMTGLIQYPPPAGSSKVEYGVLIYVKSSLSGDEPSYVAAYKRKNTAFPHQNTGDQFFTEEQFEVYRALGEHIVRRAFTGLDPVAASSLVLDPAQRQIIVDAIDKLLPGATIRLKT
ncbi:MAG: hypothetical protein ACKVON_11465 [Beijerinckiaceae bacterium]